MTAARWPPFSRAGIPKRSARDGGTLAAILMCGILKRSALVHRNQRRGERVDEAILGVYLSGTNAAYQRALALLLRGAPLKDAVSRLIGLAGQ